jgi:hypothetical protein
METTMPQFRKKPVVIEAVQWDGKKLSEAAPEWMRAALNSPGNPGNTAGCVMRMHDEIHIGTLEGVMVAKPGDWIIRGVKGELYPCKPDIFAELYDPA